MESTVKKNQVANVGKYSYKYVDIAQIHDFLENIGMRYYQYIERIEGDDYIVTVKVDKDGNESAPIRGARVVQATLTGVSNPAQEQGSALTYARRYSLLMAFGLATEDDDAQSMSRPKSSQRSTRPSTATAKQIAAIRAAFSEDRIKRMLEHYKLTKLEDMPIDTASEIISKLRRETE